jgi:prevent-host-death family protein
VELGIKEAKNQLSKLVDSALRGEEVFLTNRGKRVVQLVAAAKPIDPNRGRGSLAHIINLYPGWDSPEADKEIEDQFEFLRENGGE